MSLICVDFFLLAFCWRTCFDAFVLYHICSSIFHWMCSHWLHSWNYWNEMINFFFQQVSVSASLSLPFCAQFLHNWPTVCQAIHYSLWMWRPLFLTADLSTPKSLSLPMMIPALHLEKKKKKKYEHLAMLLLLGEKGYKLLKKKTVVPRVHTKDGEVIFIKLDYLHYKML